MPSHTNQLHMMCLPTSQIMPLGLLIKDQLSILDRIQDPIFCFAISTSYTMQARLL